MKYLNNPRKVHGKVEIVYSDTDISLVNGVEVSSNALISHPHEVYEANIIPTVKAAVMGTNTNMDGSFQMIDDTCKMGWWSNNLSSDNKTFQTPPYLEISFVSRPVGSWNIIGDSKLGEYPVDFTLEYKRDEVVVDTVTITGNTLIEQTIPSNLENITSIRLNVAKWSKANACVKILKFYDMLTESYGESDIKQFEVTEESGSLDANYSITSDTMCVSIYNKDRKFTTGYLKKLLVLDRKIKPYIGIEENGSVTYVNLGTFYSDEWKVDQDGQWVKVTAVDRMIRLQNKTYPGYNLTENTTLFDVCEDIVLKGGFKSNEYKISDSLRNIVIPKAYMGKKTIWDALQEVAYAGVCKIFIDRENKICIIRESDTTQLANVELNPNNMFSYSSDILLTEFVNRVEIEYSEISISDDVVEVAKQTLTLNPHETVEVIIDFSMDTAYGTYSINNTNVEVVNAELGVNSLKIKLRNRQDTIEEVSIIVDGSVIDSTYKIITKDDEKSISDYGVFEYKHPSSSLIQTKEQALEIATLLLNRVKAGEGVVTKVWRGSPSIKVGEMYKCVNQYGETEHFICEQNKITFDGGLKQETRGRKVTREE